MEGRLDKPSLERVSTGDRLELAAAGSWTAVHAAELDALVKGVEDARAGALTVDMREVNRLDTFGAWLLERLSRKWAARGTRMRIIGLPEHYRGLLDEVGPAVYERVDLRLSHPVAKAEMTEMLARTAPREIAGTMIREINQIDGAKYVMQDDSWLLIRPSGTEPVLRVYVEARSQDMINGLLAFGQKIAESVV